MTSINCIFICVFLQILINIVYYALSNFDSDESENIFTKDYQIPEKEYYLTTILSVLVYIN
jgi:hypothetical protein